MTTNTIPTHTIQRSIVAVLGSEPIAAYRAWSENTTGAGRGARCASKPRLTIEEAMADLAHLKSTDDYLNGVRPAIGHRYSIETMSEAAYSDYLVEREWELAAKYEECDW